ncbi:MAG: Coenzyme F420 hydrogenase/dehydrogenase, beta subunit C-terminal domain [Clostridia bacterium]|nr:Coenzyme F420 hydrogenase/dehydrogenase, beta subunit C-terminal domain [Clostridia bacterium]
MNILGYTDKERCSGCGACANVCPCDAIVFKEDEYGFKYPHIDEEKCVKCGKCVSICNSATQMQGNEPIKAFAATNKDKNALMKSSSGGVFSALADYVLENGGAVCGCVYDDNLNVVHICEESKDGILKMRKSKYVQSDMGYVIREIKERIAKGQKVLFTGTPCQVSGVNAVLGRDNKNLITVDLVCHGVPSQLIFKKFLKYLEEKHKTEIVDFDFRSKKYGWQRFTMEFTDKNGCKKNIGKGDEFYFPAFTKGFIMRPSCFTCNFACPNRVGDITMADFWGFERLNLSCDTTNGTSLCLINSQKAEKILPYLEEKLIFNEIDYDIAVKGNTCLRKPTEKGVKWETYMQACKNDEISLLAERYRKRNKKERLRWKIKLLIPISVFKFVKKLRSN